MTFVALLALANSLAFLYYGFNCLFSKELEAEFQRYGLNETQRRITGLSQILGAFGVATGLVFNEIGMIAAGGLSILMLMGFGVRLRIRDNFLQTLPSFLFMLLNAYLFYFFTFR